jgi:hypothetical protein
MQRLREKPVPARRNDIPVDALATVALLSALLGGAVDGTRISRPPRTSECSSEAERNCQNRRVDPRGAECNAESDPSADLHRTLTEEKASAIKEKS